MSEASAGRCPWARRALDIAYHDSEWGVPQHDDRRLFEFLILEGAQAGLSWSTILNKRPAYRAAYCDFDVARVAAFDDADRARLLADAGIVRNRLKIDASIGNAPCRPNSAASTVTCGSRWTAERFTTCGMKCPPCRPARRCRMPSPQT